MFKMKRTQTRIQDLRSEEDGGLTIFGLYIFACIAMVSAIAIDMSNLVAQHTKLQMTADLAAHAAQPTPHYIIATVITPAIPLTLLLQSLKTPCQKRNTER